MLQLTLPNLVRISVYFISAMLTYSGIKLLLLPPIYQFARSQSTWLYYEGYLFMGLAVVLVLCRRWLIEKLLWLSQEIHRIVSTLLMAGVIGMDVMMHIFSIPHMEGWWLPLFSGATVSAISGLVHKVWRTRAN